MNDAPALLVVCDAGPLIHLDQLDCLDLLADFSRVVVPDVVWREVEVHRPAAVNQKATRLERLKPREEPFNERNRHKPVATARGSDIYRQSHQSRSDSVHQSVPIGWPSGGSFGLVRFIFFGSS